MLGFIFRGWIGPTILAPSYAEKVTAVGNLRDRPFIFDYL